MIDPKTNTEIPQVSLTTEGRVEGWAEFIGWLLTHEHDAYELVSKLEYCTVPSSRRENPTVEEVLQMKENIPILLLYHYFCQNVLQRKVIDYARREMYGRDTQIGKLESECDEQ